MLVRSVLLTFQIKTRHVSQAASEARCSAGTEASPPLLLLCPPPLPGEVPPLLLPAPLPPADE